MNSDSLRPEQSVSSRREFLHVVGAGAAVACTTHISGAARAAETQPAAAAEKLGLKLGVASYTFRKFDLDKTLAMTKQAGLQYICLKSMHLPLESTPEQIAAAVAKIKQTGLILNGCGVVYMAKDSQVQQAFDYAKAAGMRVIVASPKPEMLPLVNQMVKKYDIRVAIHNHGPSDKVWPTPDVIIDKIGSLDPRVGLCIDIGHTVRAGANLLAMTEKYADRLFDIHMKDVTAATAKAKEVVVGRGVIDIPGFLRILLKTHYDGVVSFEYEDDASNPMPGLTASVEYVKHVLATQ
jgi:sugar phosphate isomerase/epimerase